VRGSSEGNPNRRGLSDEEEEPAEQDRPRKGDGKKEKQTNERGLHYIYQDALSANLRKGGEGAVGLRTGKKKRASPYVNPISI